MKTRHRLPRPLVALAVVLVVVAAGACAGLRPRDAGTAAAGARYFQGKCNRCHPGGRQGSGPAIDPAVAPTFLQKNGRGRHGVPGAEWTGLLAYMQTTFATSTAVAAAAPPTPVPTTTATIPVPTIAVGAVADPLAIGERVFAARCDKCHPNGQAGVAPDLIGKPLPGPLVVSDVPGRHHVPAAEMTPLLQFVAARGGGVSTVAFVAPTAGTGDLRAGAALYAAACQRCHPGGQAGVAPALVGARLPGPLHVAARPDGRHGVDAQRWDDLMAYLVTLGAVR